LSGNVPGTGTVVVEGVCKFVDPMATGTMWFLFPDRVRDLQVEAGHLSSLLDAKQQQGTAEDVVDALSLEDAAAKRFKCAACPYVSDSKSQFDYHRQFHRPRGAPYR